MLENMREDYVLYARVRGLRERAILTKHVMKNSLQSCVTAIGMSIPQLIAGTIVVENGVRLAGPRQTLHHVDLQSRLPRDSGLRAHDGGSLRHLQSDVRHHSVCG